MPPTIIEGTWEEIERRKAELIGRYLRVTIQPEHSFLQTVAPVQAAATRPISVLGKYAFVSGGSEEFAQEKQTEIEREDRVHP